MSRGTRSAPSTILVLAMVGLAAAGLCLVGEIATAEARPPGDPRALVYRADSFPAPEEPRSSGRAAVFEVLAAVIIFAPILAFLGYLLVAHYRCERRRQEAWARAARSASVSRRARIEVPVDDIDVVVDTRHRRGPLGIRLPSRVTRASAAYAAGRGPRFRIYRERISTSIGKRLGAQDVVLGGSAAFDETFVVKCEEPALVRRLWTARAMERMLLHFEGAMIRSDGAQIRLDEPGVWDEPRKVRAAIELVAELAGRDLYGSAALRAVTGAVSVDSEGGAPRVEVAAAARVVLGPEVRKGALVTVARLGADPGRSAMTIASANAGGADPALLSQLPSRAQIHLGRSGSGTLIVDGERTRFVWDAIETDPERLRAGADLLSALFDHGPGGVFR